MYDNYKRRGGDRCDVYMRQRLAGWEPPVRQGKVLLLLLLLLYNVLLQLQLQKSPPRKLPPDKQSRFRGSRTPSMQICMSKKEGGAPLLPLD